MPFVHSGSALRFYPEWGSADLRFCGLPLCFGVRQLAAALLQASLLAAAVKSASKLAREKRQQAAALQRKSLPIRDGPIGPVEHGDGPRALRNLGREFEWRGI